MVASQVENQYTVVQTLGKEFHNTGSCMEEWTGLNSNDYESCTYETPSSVINIESKAFNENPLTSVKLNNLNTEIECKAIGNNSSINHNLPNSYDFNDLCK